MGKIDCQTAFQSIKRTIIKWISNSFFPQKKKKEKSLKIKRDQADIIHMTISYQTPEEE
jgi:hypothetical protein